MDARELSDEEELTQFGAADGFHATPRDKDKGGLSLLLGHLGVDKAAWYVRVAQSREPYSGDQVRVTTVGSLRQRGFRVTHTPNPINPLHVRVEPEGVWDDISSVKFDESFKEG